MLTIKYILLTALLLVLCSPGFVIPKEKEFKEYEVKAVFLERFTRFIEWPDIDPSDMSRADDQSKTFIIALIGKNPFGGILDRIYAERKIKGRAVEIRYVVDEKDIFPCHILFVSQYNKDNLSRILSLTRDKPILTVSDCQGFAEQGVLINFFLDARRVRFEINESAVRKSGLKMSFHLLRSAKIINPIKER